MILLETFDYSIFILLSLLLSMITPALLTLKLLSGEQSTLIYKTFDTTYEILEIFKVNLIFVFFYNKIKKIYLLLTKYIESFISKISNRFEINTNKKYQYTLKNRYILSFINLLTVLSTIGVITILYYIVTLINLSDVCISFADTIFYTLRSDLSIRSLLVATFGNFESLKILFEMDFWIVHILFQILFTYSYIIIIYTGSFEVSEINDNFFYENPLSKFSGFTSFTLINILILIGCTFLTLLLLSSSGAVNPITLILLVLNVFNIEISLSITAMSLAPIYIEKTCTTIITSIFNNNSNNSNYVDLDYDDDYYDNNPSPPNNKLNNLDIY